MSIDLMNRVWWREDLKTMEKFVALALADAAGDDGSCYPSIDRLAKKCSCVRRTVQTALKGLEKKRLIKRYRRVDRTDYYQMVIEQWPHQDRPENTAKESKFGKAEAAAFKASEPSLFGENDTGEGNAPVDKTGVQDIPDGVHLTTSTGAGDAPKPLEEPLVETLESSCAISENRTHTKEDLRRFIEERWAGLKQAHPQISGLRRVTDTLLDLAIQQANQNMKEGETHIDVWEAVFEQIPKSEFLLGLLPPGPGRTARYKLSMSHLVKPHMFRRVVNGDFDKQREGFDPATGEVLGPAAAATGSAIDRVRQARQPRPGAGSDNGPAIAGSA